MDNQRGMTTAIQSPSMTVSRKHPTILGSHHRLLDLLAIITATTCMLVVLLTLIMCSLDPAGRWAVDANSKGELLLELTIITIAAPLSIIRLFVLARSKQWTTSD